MLDASFISALCWIKLQEKKLEIMFGQLFFPSGLGHMGAFQKFLCAHSRKEAFSVLRQTKQMLKSLHPDHWHHR